MSPYSAEVMLLAILTVATYSLVGLLAIWAGLGRPHWFLRVALVGGVLLSLLLIPAFEPLVLFSIQSAVVILPLMLLKSVRGHVQAVGPDAGATARGRLQFSLLDVLLLTVVVAVIVAAAAAAEVPSDLSEFWAYARNVLKLPSPFAPLAPMSPAEVWMAFGLVGLGLGLSTLAAAWVALGRRRLWLRLIALCLLPTSAVMVALLALIRSSGWLASGTPQADSPAASRPMVRRVAKLAALLLSLLILLPPLVVFCVLVVPAPDRPETVLPDPNGYQDLVAAGKAFELAGVDNLDMVISQQPLDMLDMATRQQLQAFVASCGHAFDTARVGLARECQVPIWYSWADYEADDLDISALRPVVRALRAEGKLAELEGRPADAAGSYLDMIRLGRVGTRGGLLIAWLTGRACEGMGMAALAELRESLTSGQCNDLIDTLQTLEANREPVEEVCARDQLWGRIVLEWKWQLIHIVRTITGSEPDVRPLLEKAADQTQASFRLLICGLALRSYSVENAQPPEKLGDLVPDYLREVPLDPFSGKPLVYRREAAKYVLYSVGPDSQDDGGQLHGYSDPGTDILLDKPPEEEEE